jgi:hypothetical protein
MLSWRSRFGIWSDRRLFSPPPSAPPHNAPPTTGRTRDMQRQDDFQITRTDMLLFIAQLLSLADAIIRIVALGRPIDDRLLHAFVRTEHAMLIVLGGIVSNTDTRGATPGLDDIIDFDEPNDRQAELLRIGVSLRQIARSLALILAMNPRAFRDRQRLSSCRSRAAEPGIQGCDGGGLVLRPLKPAPSSSRLFPISGLRIPLRGSAMTDAQQARAPP